MRRAVRAIVVKDDKLLKDLAGVPFRTPELQQAILLGLRHGFPKEPIELDRQYLEHIHRKVKKG
jgi:hypothetical protein